MSEVGPISFSAANIFQEILAKGFQNDVSARPSLGEVKAGKVLLAVTRRLELLLLIPVSDHDHPDIALSDSLTIGMRTQIDDNGKELDFLALSTAPDFDIALFGAICDQAILQLPTSDNYVQLLMNIVESWRELLNSLTNKSFSPTKAIGLFGELLFFRDLLEINKNGILSAWVGPEGARYDFMFLRNCLEVKTTTRTDRLEIAVHGIDQFGQVEDKTSWLGLAQIEWDPNGLSLQSLIDDIRNELPDASLFNEKLSLLGIRDEVWPVLDAFRFTLKSLFLDPITDKLPFLNSEELGGIVDLHRFNAIQYVVNLEGLCTKVTNEGKRESLVKLCQ